MSDRDRSRDVLLDLSLLYELTLSVGSSLDLQENCKAFLDALVTRKNLAFASVWVLNASLPEPSPQPGATLVAAVPAFRTGLRRIPADHPLMQRLSGSSPFSAGSSDPEFQELVTERGISKGCLAVFPLEELGFLKIHSLSREEPFDSLFLNQLRAVTAQFAVSLGGCLAYSRLRQEMLGRVQAEQVQRSLYRISEAAHTSKSLRDLFRAIHESIAGLMDARNFYIALRHPSEDLIEFPYFVDEEDPPPQPKPMGRGLTEYVIRTGAPLLATPEVFARLVESGEVESIGAPSIDWLGVPLRGEFGTFGAMVVQTYAEGIRYGEREREILAFVSTQVAMAIERRRQEDALAYEMQLWNALLERIPDSIYFKDRQSRFVRVNRAQAKILGVSDPALAIGKTDADYFPPEHALAALKDERTVLSTGMPLVDKIERIDFPDGRTRWFVTTKVPVRDASGEATGLVGSSREITDLKIAEEQLRLQESLFQQLFENSPEAIVLLDVEDRVLMANGAFEELFGYTRDELQGAYLHALIVPDELADEAARFSSQAQGGRPLRQESVRRRKDGTIVPVDILGYPVLRGQDQIGVYGIYRDIGERKRSQERLHQLAHYDALTGLPNRTLFQERTAATLVAARDKGARSAMLLLDLDRFKEVNDAMGYDAGDQLLRAIARRLDKRNPGDAVIARIGSDEFAILLPEVASSEEAAEEGKRILRSISEPYFVASHECHMTGSLGISLTPEDGEDVDLLLRHAQSACYRAKVSGGNDLRLFRAEMSQQVTHRVHLRAMLRKAIEQENLVAHYQPLVSLHTGHISAAEALLRWPHPEHGMIGPAVFIPLAEETDLILPLGEWILRTACGQVKSWQRDLPNALSLTVNLSPRQFRDRNIVASIEGILRQTGIEPAFLQLEITEGTAMWDVEGSVETMKRLAGLGVRLAIDDFGKGYSSLYCLKTFPVQTIKVDQAFTADVARNPEDAAIVRAIIDMAHAIGLEVVAEGVEKEEQFDFLRSAGCDYLQGYYFSTPLPPEGFRSFLDKWLRFQP
jgi:diguanylate cyclase (GGDEF)-like protein/PAS domain S-box-containing protein